jgi:hypothetical protein
MLIVTVDEGRSDFNKIWCVALTEADTDDTDLELYDYVRIESGNNAWVGQVTSANYNLSTVARSLDPTLLYALELKSKGAEAQLADYTRVWEITLLGQYIEDEASTLRTRPDPGAEVKQMDRDATVSFLNLPELRSFISGRTNAIGELMNAEEVPLCLNSKVFNHGILIVGGMGSGKSNTGANCVQQAVRHGYVTFMYDVKPDFQQIDEPNDDEGVASIWPRFAQYEIAPAAAEEMTRIGFYIGDNVDYGRYDIVIGFNASEFSPTRLASFFTFNENQEEEFIQAAQTVRDRNENGGRITPYRLDDIIAALRTKRNRPNQSPYVQSSIDATINRIDRRRDSLRWLDSVGRYFDQANGDDNPFADVTDSTDSVQRFSIRNLVQRSGIIHFDCVPFASDMETYAVLLSTIISKAHYYKANNRNNAPKLLHYIDEAHKIFRNRGRFEEMLSRSINTGILEGRALNHCFILATQNAVDVPVNLLNNLNTQIVMRQNNLEVARAACQTMGREFAEQSVNLARGQALCHVFESSATVLVRMAPSPYNLIRPQEDQANDYYADY